MDTVDHLARLQLGENTEKLHLHHKDEHCVAALRLAEQAKRSISIFTYDLDPALYNQQAFLDAVKLLAIGGPLTRIRILLQNNERVQKQGHRLLELSRRLTSKIEIRRPHNDYINTLENFLIADGTGYLRRTLHTRYEGEVCFNCRLEAGKYENFFNEVWDCSSADSDLRRLHI